MNRSDRRYSYYRVVNPGKNDPAWVLIFRGQKREAEILLGKKLVKK